jgi:hypothetical protein
MRKLSGICEESAGTAWKRATRNRSLSVGCWLDLMTTLIVDLPDCGQVASVQGSVAPA